MSMNISNKPIFLTTTDGTLINPQYIIQMQRKEEWKNGEKTKSDDYSVTLFNATSQDPLYINKKEIKKLDIIA